MYGAAVRCIITMKRCAEISSVGLILRQSFEIEVGIQMCMYPLDLFSYSPCRFMLRLGVRG
jgi:hypothetical protein